MKIGDYVTAAIVGENTSIQGIYIRDLGQDQIFVEGQREMYLCYKHDAVVVPDKNLWGDTREFVQRWRNEHIGS